MDIQFAEEYKNAEKGETERGFLEQSEPGLERGRTLGAGAREKESEPGARTRKMESELGLERGRSLDTWSQDSREGVRARGPNSEDGVGAGAREKTDAVRKMSMKRRRD